RASLDQYKLSASSAAADWLRDLRTWASEAIDVLAEAAYHSPRADTPPPADTASFLKTCRCRLSALIDRGRLLLPNQQEAEVGTHKPHAYKGLRHPSLDALVAAERILGGDMKPAGFPDRKAALIGLRREFVSSIQAIIDPHSFNREIARLLTTTADDRKRDPTLGGLLPNPESVPTGAEGLLAIAAKRYLAERDDHRPKRP
ncbi:MAG TPA: hypothetical protein PKA50_14830, partial [Gemmatimonadales bacterium]|nr:hypothetical protein [Gemmatimonadales bacterium]